MNDLDSVHTLTFDKPGQFKAGTVQGLNLALKYLKFYVRFKS